jgi:hypothetical protein
MANVRITYAPNPGTTAEAELDALAAVYRFILGRHTEKKATRSGGPDDAMKGSKHDRATPNHSR